MLRRSSRRLLCGKGTPEAHNLCAVLVENKHNVREKRLTLTLDYKNHQIANDIHSLSFRPK